MLRKNLIVFILLFLFSSYVHCQNTQLENGYHSFKYPNGTISSEGLIRDGKPDGYWKSYFVTGVIKSEGKRRNFLLDSIWVFYTQTGDTIEKIDYILGKKSGYYLKYKRDNIFGLYVWSRELYASDKREGIAYLYFANGNIKQTIPYNNGKKQGLSKEFDENGSLITLYEYNNDFLISRERINRYDKNRLKTGEWREFHDNGNIKYEMTYRENLLHGYYKEYNQRGILVTTMLYDNGNIVEDNIEDDPEIEIINRYDNQGNLIYSGPFRINTPVGIHREYDSEGNITNSKIYNDLGVLMSEGIVSEEGQRNGTWKNYFENGNVKEEGTYLNNRRSGKWNFYNTEGSKVQEGQYRTGRTDGLWKWYYDDGSIIREEDYFQGNRDGKFTEYSADGKIISQGQFVDNEKNGSWIYTVGDHREEGNYIIGLRDGVWKYFDDEGNIKYKGMYVQGNPDRFHFYYWDNGKVKEEQYFDMGLKHKTWKKYDEEGILLMSITYRNDEERRINGIRVRLPESDIKLIK